MARPNAIPMLAAAALVAAALSLAGHAGAGDDKDKDEDDGPSVPKALPAGAALPEPPKLVPVRPDVYAGRVTALSRIVQCPKCSGDGVKVSRVREATGHLQKPKVREVHEECADCRGTGYSLDPDRVAPVLDSFVSLLGALPADAPGTAKQLEKARGALLRLGGTGELAERITTQDRNEVTAERAGKPGTPIAVTGIVGKPIPVAGGRVLPVQVEANSAVLLRAPVINAAPAEGKVLVGGIAAGAVANVEWQWGKVVVLDHGFIVPLTEPVNKGAADVAKSAEQGAGSRPSGSGR
ncbi:MAG: hypothetical protein ACKOEL_10670 [Planctomycetota bacterium]